MQCYQQPVVARTTLFQLSENPMREGYEMSTLTTRKLSILSTLFTLATANPAFATDGTPFQQFYGIGEPASIAMLPDGTTKTRLQNLPHSATKNALQTLQQLSFPASDLALMQIDNNGGIFYADNFTLPSSQPAQDALAEQEAKIAGKDVFKLHSNPGADKVVYLDFNGEIIHKRAWNTNTPLYATEAYDIDGDKSHFNLTEQASIYEIWQRVAEDFAAFDIDVTTEPPLRFGRHTGHLLITNSTDARGQPLPAATSSVGAAYAGVFGSPGYTHFSPAIIYADKLHKRADYIAEVASHQFGHQLGLSHDGRTTPAEHYYSGHGTENQSWGPIMGSGGLHQNITQWSKGEYPAANNPQDDLAIISQQLNYRSDDHGDLFDNATILALQPDGHQGVISQHNDIDMFRVDVSQPGSINLTISPAWSNASAAIKQGANLDIAATLYDSNGHILLHNAPSDNTSAQISAAVNPGSYYLSVQGSGNATSPYSDYASLGQYAISGEAPNLASSAGPALASTSSPKRSKNSTENITPPEQNQTQKHWKGLTCNSVTYSAPSSAEANIEFIFDQAYPCGQFANGDWWVADPLQNGITIVDMLPRTDQGMHGAEIQPSYTNKQGFDKRISHYDASLTPSLPAFIPYGDIISLVKTASVTSSSCKVCLQFAAVLTVVPEPLANSQSLLRPGYFGTNKSLYSTDNLNLSSLGTLPSIGILDENSSTFDNLAQRYHDVQLDHLIGWYGRAMHPVDNMPDYGASIARDNATTVLRMLLDDFNPQEPAKQQTLISYLQMAVDLQSMVSGGANWYADGGHGNGRKLPLLFAGQILNQPSFIETAQQPRFSEDQQVYLSPVTNQALFGRACSDSSYWKQQRYGTGPKDCRDPYGLIDGGGSYIGYAYQYCCTSKPWKYTALATRLLRLESEWNNPVFFAYVDRWVNHGVIAAPDECAPFNGDRTAYGQLYGPDNINGGCIKGAGRSTSVDGINADGGYYGHTLSERMWDAFKHLQ